MNGMEKLTDTAARHGWVRDQELSGWSRMARYRRGDQWIEATRTVDGRVLRATRSWGATTIVVAPKVADQVMVWMTEPMPGEDRDRSVLHARALENGWTYVGFTGSGRTYARSTDRITVMCNNAGGLVRAQRNFSGPGADREIHTNLVGNILPWFTTESAGARHVAALKEGIPAKPAQEAAPTPIRSAYPLTPDRRLWRLLEALEDSARSVRTTFPPEGAYDSVTLAGMISDLKLLQADVLRGIETANRLLGAREADSIDG